MVVLCLFLFLSPSRLGAVGRILVLRPNKATGQDPVVEGVGDG